MPATDADDLELICTAAREAGLLAMRWFRGNPEVWMKPGQSPVSEADYAVDRLLNEILLSARPDYGWLSEETVDDPVRLSARRTFVVDPIDGTRAFIDGRDVWCVSIAVVEDGRTVAGVLDCPARGEIFEAVRGSGARLNGRSLSITSAQTPPKLAGPKPVLDRFAAGGEVFSSHAYVPSLAYRLAMVADGRLDGTFVKPNANDWDLAAADLIVSESGGSVLDAAGQHLAYARANPVKGVLAAGSGTLLARMVATIGDVPGTG